MTTWPAGSRRPSELFPASEWKSVKSPRGLERRSPHLDQVVASRTLPLDISNAELCHSARLAAEYLRPRDAAARRATSPEMGGRWAAGRPQAGGGATVPASAMTHGVATA